MPDLSKLTLILHTETPDKRQIYQRADDKRTVNPADIEFLKAYPNPVMIYGMPTQELIRLMEPDNCFPVPKRANALIAGRGRIIEGRRGDIEVRSANYIHLRKRTKKRDNN
ncbi:MAG: hypothetical protein Q7S06_02530 [Nanoarchaeota archaeon]|nr:hypothetical protein [Nanoarchaeota archaeon]